MLAATHDSMRFTSYFIPVVLSTKSVRMGSHSCVHCQKLTLDFHMPKDAGERLEFGMLGPERTELQDGTVFDFSFEDLRSAAHEGCDLCRYILSEPSINRFEVAQVARRKDILDRSRSSFFITVS